MKKINFTKITVIGLCLLLFAAVFQSAAFARNNTEHAGVDLNQKVDYIFKSFERLLKKNNWKTVIEGNQLRAFLFYNNYSELTVNIETEIRLPFYLFRVSIKRNDKTKYREFKIHKDEIRDNKKIKNTILPFLIVPVIISRDSEDLKKAYFSTISMGYHRANDNREFYPYYNEGSAYFSGIVLYDPSYSVKNGEVALGLGEYYLFNCNFAADTAVREHLFNIDMMVYGKSINSSNKDGGSRILYGFFNGMEFYRPGMKDATLRWNREMYTYHPHIQYLIWRAVQFNFIGTIRSSGIYTFSFMTGFGPSTNSSLTATSVTEEEQENMNRIFASIRYRRQNYYFSYCFPISGSIILDRVWRFRFEAGYNFYYFFPVRNEEAYDILNVARGSAGFYITDNLLFAVNYEYWHIKSRVTTEKVTHYWNRLILEFRYIL